MITPELLSRINELARKKRTVGLSEEELAEQQKLYRIYLDGIRGQMTSLLDSIEFVDEPQPQRKIVKQTNITLGKKVYH